MYLCYVDESGTPDCPGNTSHFVLSGIALPIKRWKECDRQINALKDKHALSDTELHTGWIARKYPEQKKIPNFEKLTHGERRRLVTQYRQAELLRLQRSNNRKTYLQNKKNYRHSDPYIHLTHSERMAFLQDVADCVGRWKYARLFAECIDKIHFVSIVNPLPVDEQAFEQIITRLEAYLENTRNRKINDANYCLVIHDNNETSAKKHTELMHKFHKRGTFWRKIGNIIETPLFVDSSLTGMVQIADLCAYSLRRYCENGEGDLFGRIFPIADRNPRGVVVGARHFTRMDCKCDICVGHRGQPKAKAASVKPAA